MSFDPWMPGQGVLAAAYSPWMPYCMMVPGLAILSFVAYYGMKLAGFLRGARKVTGKVSWLPRGKDFARVREKKGGMAMLRDEELMRRYRFMLWVRIRPPDGEEPVEIGLVTSGYTLSRELEHGDELEVLYNPERPEAVYLPGENKWIGLILVGIMGLILTGFALANLVRTLR
ncbi:hypothetical protein JRI60_38230 [Archangium violaceum]|uniref:DUF3592 domain-containing protein n=1 Tax=Archangium violaceum TaxID=83451 RepID=UPI00194ED94B|nr:DUF3592 domain-containing protein [Archangium violaceum]QRN94901.1 hypothetical protein JRI60_38230 [Archangium violaceum]